MSSSAGGGSVGHVQQQQHHQLQHQTKFRWTENLTCRFIQLRKEHGKMFTGRKYSAQAGWEYILRQMREEFPTIMADVHYRVLKKKWSNLLQQYKELKNPVHGDKNKADDISWPFYTAIDEVLGRHSQQHHSQHHAQQHHGSNALHARRHYDSPDEPDNNEEFEDDEEPDDDLNPQEFLCVSVAPDSDEDNDPTDSLDLPNYAEEDGDATGGRVPGLPRLQPLGRGPVFDVDRLQSATTRRSSPGVSRKPTARGSLPRDSSSEELLSRLPRATELTIRPIPRQASCFGSEPPSLAPIINGRELEIFRDVKRSRSDEEDEEHGRGEDGEPRSKRAGCSAESARLERKLDELLEYTRRRDEENRGILLRMLEAVEGIRDAMR